MPWMNGEGTGFLHVGLKGGVPPVNEKLLIHICIFNYNFILFYLKHLLTHQTAHLLATEGRERTVVIQVQFGRGSGGGGGRFTLGIAIVVAIVVVGAITTIVPVALIGTVRASIAATLSTLTRFNTGNCLD